MVRTMTIRGHRLVFGRLTGGHWLCVSCAGWNHWHEPGAGCDVPYCMCSR